jgi:methionyl-tRNA synthetase
MEIMNREPGHTPDLETIKRQIDRPTRVVVTAGMPYANGPVHIGHLAGAHVPADIHARWMRMLIGAENVLFVSGTDDHGSPSELAAIKAGVPVREFVDTIHRQQRATLERYGISLDVYSGTSREDCFPIQKALVDQFVRQLYRHGMLEKRTTRQWFDIEMQRFLQDRLVRGRCPNPKCGNDNAYSDECDSCGTQYDPSQLIDPRSSLNGSVPVLRDTVHWWLDMWKVADVLKQWIETKEGTWRSALVNEVLHTVLPSLSFANTFEAAYKPLKAGLPPHKSRYGPGRTIVLQFQTKDDLARGREELANQGIASDLLDGWAHRSITRDVAWGIPLPDDLDPDMAGKTLYVWADSLIAPIAFSRVALNLRGAEPARDAEFWRNPDAQIAQFLGQDNVFFYVVMQGALWLGSQDDPLRLPRAGDYQFTDVFACYHLKVDGDKMSKSRGNFITGDQVLERGYSADQIRYFLALLNLPEKAANFDFETLNERNRFLAGPINSALEKPIAAAHSKFGGRVPEGVLSEKVVAATVRIAQRYVRAMSRAEYSTLLYDIETYARQVNSLFTQHKPHDDRYPEQPRRDALYSSFYVLKTLMILLYPFVPETMDRVRQSLALGPEVFSIEELGRPIPAGHMIGPQQPFFPNVPEQDPIARPTEP